MPRRGGRQQRSGATLTTLDEAQAAAVLSPPRTPGGTAVPGPSHTLISLMSPRQRPSAATRGTSATVRHGDIDSLRRDLLRKVCTAGWHRHHTTGPRLTRP
jgi:hypothetical protein